MDKLLVFIIGFVPGILWLIYFYKKDKYEPEPVKLIVKTYFLGIVIAIPISALEAPFAGSGFIAIVFAAPIIEEYGKYFIVRKKLYPHIEFNEPVDGIIYAVSAALGFASIENGGYIIGTYMAASDAAIEVTIGIFITRALLSVPGHALFSSMWGYALGVTKFSDNPDNMSLVRKGLFLAMLLHGLFNLLVGTFPLLAILLLILVPVMWKMANKRIREALARSPFVENDSQSDE